MNVATLLFEATVHSLCGPSCVFTNVVTPRAGVERKDEFAETPVGEGATIGANATVVCGHMACDQTIAGTRAASPDFAADCDGM